MLYYCINISNVFRDFGDANPDLEQARAILAAKIVAVLDRRTLSVRAAQALTGVAASEFPASATSSWRASPSTARSRSSASWIRTCN